MYVGGYFSKAGGDPGDNIAKWDGTQWSEVGGGLNPSNVMALQVYKGELYAAGQINDAGGLPVTRMARWDGAQWYDAGTDFRLGDMSSGTPGTLAVFKNDLYIGGGFKTINGDTMNNIAKYDYTVGVNELQVSNCGFQVYPNPSEGKFTIVSRYVGTQVEKIEVYNILGEKVYQSANTPSHLGEGLGVRSIYLLNPMEFTMLL